MSLRIGAREPEKVLGGLMLWGDLQKRGDRHKSWGLRISFWDSLLLLQVGMKITCGTF